ncbi:MAG TPA: SDR family NAD(P)-dependent oxidoreductase, partial [Opitutaceae bacterium]|nr:SDR family NAD(P)-dependent oxidoreductase [Opitutaceae bacterium]
MTPASTPPPPTFSLAGHVVLLTGGAGLYGRGLASHLAAAGATLILAARNVAALETVAAEERALGRSVQARRFDQ